MQQLIGKILLISGIIFFLSACVSGSSTNSTDFDRRQAAKARVELGLGYLNQGDTALAKLNLDKALSYAPDYYLVHSALAYFYQRQGDTQRAQEAYLSAIKADSQQGDVLNNYGAFLCAQGEYSQAYQQFRQALDTPNYYNQADTYENMALCASAEKNTALYRQYLDLLSKQAPERARALAKIAE
ncbi:type IV pilus biogenesis/stability protein PilW [Caviibacterium pharyngocola]|uniref:Type IV pilus biogenesis/stability protein PilW n=1 Tax=Caviibacterium pharyngocola TaxID=28159 RepID=A0A2M8RZ28_9PAST|nr:type IV pilus biogenesis/stability protein PilW [Caviibacterium pharyngocola]PJG84142.1 type IV pilus biogenesis/stability protein PilW [Caviibacterium pharyngocola]